MQALPSLNIWHAFILFTLQVQYICSLPSTPPPAPLICSLTFHPSPYQPAPCHPQVTDPPQIHNLLTSCKFQSFLLGKGQSSILLWHNKRSLVLMCLKWNNIWNTCREKKTQTPFLEVWLYLFSCVLMGRLLKRVLWMAVIIKHPVRSDGYGLSHTSRPLHQVSFAPLLEQIIRLSTKLW